MSGFSDKVFEEAVAAQFKCPVCTFVLKDPVQAPCGHLFCLSCIQKAIRNFDAVCPVCNSGLTEDKLHLDKAVKKEMSFLAVKCPNEGYGCEWKGTLGQLENQHQKQCPFLPAERSRNANMPQEHQE